MRVAIGGLHTECSSYNPVKMTDDDFTIWRGDEMLQQRYFDLLSQYNATYLPTFYARNIAGGPVARATYNRFKSDYIARLREALPLDGVYLAMHGAVFVEDMHDAEGDWISATREIVGPDCVIAVSYDLHGNLSQRIIDAIDVFSTYRTAPHIDIPQTQKRTLDMLFRCLNTGQKPYLAWAPVPVLLPGERTSTEDEPAKSLYASLPKREADREIWDASMMVGYVWADEPRTTAAAVITGTDRTKTEKSALELAQAYWDAREEFEFGMETGSVSECVSRALSASSRPVILAESGDNPTGGGVGDRTELLRELLDQRAEDTIFAGICDQPAVDACFAAGETAQITLKIGGSLDPSSAPVIETVTVLRLANAVAGDQRQAVVQVGGIKLVLSARRRPYHKIADFIALGLDPQQARIIAVKSGYLSPELAPLANPALMLLSPGVVDQYIERLPRDHKPAPTYPFDKGFDWAARAFFKSAQS